MTDKKPLLEVVREKKKPKEKFVMVEKSVIKKGSKPG